MCIDACKEAKKKGVIISCDLNYRNKLWSREKAKEIMTKVCQYVDVCIANEEDAGDVFGIKADHTNLVEGKVDKAGYEQVAEKLLEEFPFKAVAITLRESLSASDNNWSAILYDGKQFFHSKKYMMRIVDRVGGGDSFAGALIYAMLNKFDGKEAIEYATAASCLKHSIEGDFNIVTVDEVKKLADGDSSGRVQR